MNAQGQEQLQSNFDAQIFVAELPLYKTVHYSTDCKKSIQRFYGTQTVTVDLLCRECNMISTFRTSGTGFDELRDAAIAIGRGPGHAALPTPQFFGVNVVKLNCTRRAGHHINLLVSGGVKKAEGDDGRASIFLRKVGQDPSHADLARAEFSGLSSFVDKVDRAEFVRSAGLASAGVNIGAFVYLRRLFERLIERARLRSEVSHDMPGFQNKRVHEKIECLSDVLPPFLVENSSVYRFLSSGIHELDEETCGGMYPVLRESVLLMLKQEKAIEEERRQREELARRIAQLNSIARS